MHGACHDGVLHTLFEKLEKTSNEEELEEKVVLEISKRVMSLLRDNPRLVKFLLEA